jgi:hypothetical protein
MTNKFGIPEIELKKIRSRDKKCVYCNKEMIFPFDVNKRQDSATIEHLNFHGPFYWKEDLDIKDVVICCGSCNSSRGIKKLRDWFKSKYCIERNINKNTVAKPVKEYLIRNKVVNPNKTPYTKSERPSTITTSAQVSLSQYFNKLFLTATSEKPLKNSKLAKLPQQISKSE